jgi:hypothetical protein
MEIQGPTSEGDRIRKFAQDPGILFGQDIIADQPPGVPCSRHKGQIGQLQPGRLVPRIGEGPIDGTEKVIADKFGIGDRIVKMAEFPVPARAAVDPTTSRAQSKESGGRSDFPYYKRSRRAVQKEKTPSLRLTQ